MANHLIFMVDSKPLDLGETLNLRVGTCVRISLISSLDNGVEKRLSIHSARLLWSSVLWLLRFDFSSFFLA